MFYKVIGFLKKEEIVGTEEMWEAFGRCYRLPAEPETGYPLPLVCILLVL